MKTLYLKLANSIKGFNLVFVSVICILQILGLIALYSATHGVHSHNESLFQQQLIWLGIGWALFFLLFHIDYSFIKRAVWFIYLIHIGLLVFVIFFGKQIYSAKRWIDLGLFNYQPSEFLKLALVLLLAHKLASREFGKSLNIKELLEYLLIFIFPIGLVMIQPDLGTAGILLLILSSLILFNGIHKKTLIISACIGLISLPIFWNFVLKDYQKNRVISFIHPEKDPKGMGYNLIQSKIAIGNGQLTGRGFGKGTQTKLHFLPERHTDFIFSVLSEEHGFIGSGVSIALFFFLIYLIITYAFTSRSRFGCFLCLGACVFLFWHIFLNLAMTMGLFPVVGAPLPLMSYGGSHLLTTMAFLGLAGSVNKRKDLF